MAIYQNNGGFVPERVNTAPFIAPSEGAAETRHRMPDGWQGEIDDFFYYECEESYYEFDRYDHPYYDFCDTYYEFGEAPFDHCHWTGAEWKDVSWQFRDQGTARPASKAMQSEALRVVHVGPHLVRGGAEQWLIDLARAVDPAEVAIVRHVALNPRYVDREYVADLMDCGIMVEAGGAESLANAARDADVLLSWGVELDRYLQRRPKALSVQVVHGDGHWNRHFLERSRHGIDHAVAVSHRVHRRICYDVPSTVIYNGIDLERLGRKSSREAMRARLGLQEGDFLVGFFGRLAPEKRTATILQAVATLSESVKVLLVGKGPLEGELREMGQALLPGRAHFTTANGNIGDLYDAVDAVCLASNQEGFPLVMLEAMLSERPVLSTPVGSACEVIDDRITGLLHDGSSADLAAAINLLFRYPAWRLALAAEGRRRAEQFGHAARMARDYTHLLKTLTAEHRRPS
ncbi:MAG TPA: glycosyltransferase [Chloroflexota bacterium]|jgi:glycosyltransferase involved in cell wall biosynthesis|nr:glycosyltransferase [Chloroflexota bacterium]